MDPKNILILIIWIPKKGTPTLGKPQRWGEASISIHKLRRDTVGRSDSEDAPRRSTVGNRILGTLRAVERSNSDDAPRKSDSENAPRGGAVRKSPADPKRTGACPETHLGTR